MNKFLILLIGLVMLNGSIACAAEADDGTLIDVHDPAYGQYLSQYYARYHAMNGQSVPELQSFAAEKDQQGFPKWFDGPQGENTLTMLLVTLFTKKQFDDLEKLVNDWNTPDNRMADGRLKLRMLVEALKHRFAQKAWTDDYQIIKSWRTQYPQSSAAALVEAKYWNEYAWDARGYGSANAVTQQGSKLFSEREHLAEKTLLDSESYAASNPIWYSTFLRVGRSLDWPIPSLLKFSVPATQKFPYYYDIYINSLGPLRPQWGGSWKLVDDYIKAVTQQTQATEGNSLYARLYMMVDCDCGDKPNLFRETLASWPEMKKGFEDMMKRYPHSAWNLNNFAAYACRAGDKATFQSLRFQMGKNVTPEAWPSSYSLDLCEHQFPDQAL